MKITGFNQGNTGAQNQVALRNAIARAIAARAAVLELPSGNIQVRISGSHLPTIGNLVPVSAVISGPLRIKGQGKGKTTLTATDFIAATGGAMFQCSAGVYEVIFEDMTIVGPVAASMIDDLTISWAVWMGGGLTARFNRVEFKQWFQCTKASPEYPAYPGTGNKVYFENCRISFYTTGPLHIAGTDLDSDVCEFSRCEFEWDSAITAVPQRVGTNGQYHATYIGTGVAFAMDNCRVISTGGHTSSIAGYGFLHYGGSGNGRYSRCTSNYFGPAVRSGIRTSGTTPTQVSGCTFMCGTGSIPIRPGGDFSVTDCIFAAVSGTPVYGIVDDQAADTSATITNCRFLKLGGNGFTYAVRRITGSKVWNLIGGQIGDVSSFGLGVDGGVVVARGVDFAASTGRYNSILTGGRLILIDCITSGSLPHYADQSTSNSVLELWRNKWLANALTEIQSPTVGYTLTILGGDNLFYESSGGIGDGFAIVSGTNLSNISGKLQPGRGLGTYIFDGSHAMTANQNYDTYAWNEPGDVTINDIYMQGASAAGVAASDHNRFHNATIRIRAKQAFKLGSSGNIVAGGSDRTGDAVVTLTYMPADGKWYEV